ncbi:hypothetical protein B296_00015994 [Ensete ventricosum]|uniref:EF-hand domain-containing protein n=1 Tax=Ensete ventricosum TaxID=4639 RepID=A0A427B3L4_ENSVE|nr:hypothetical protein B296_00015994 [Ensete ventricosum]
MFGPTRRNIGGWTESDSWKFYAVKTYEDPADDGAIRAFGSRTVGPALPSGRSIRRRGRTAPPAKPVSASFNFLFLPLFEGVLYKNAPFVPWIDITPNSVTLLASFSISLLVHDSLPGSSSALVSCLPFRSQHGTVKLGSRKERTVEPVGDRRQQRQRRNMKKRMRMGCGSMVGSERCVSCTTFNILAPIYKRLSEGVSSPFFGFGSWESQYRAYWLSRNERIIDRLLGDRSSIIWNDELVGMYEKRLGDAGYVSFKLARTNNRGDGLLTAVHGDYFKILNHRKLLFNDLGDRVAQLLHVGSVVPFWQGQKSSDQQQVLIVNTHLLFPHDSSLCIVRLQQVDFLFLSIYPLAIFCLCYQWVSHRNHRGNICGVDFIWLLNPNKYRKPLRTSWNEAVFSIIKLGVAGHPHGLSPDDTKDLWIQADTDGNGVVDYEEFQQRIWSPKCWEPLEEQIAAETEGTQAREEGQLAFGFNVKDAVLFPPEVEQGTWPENYSLSDHAPLTVVFSPVRIPGGQPVC